MTLDKLTDKQKAIALTNYDYFTERVGIKLNDATDKYSSEIHAINSTIKEMENINGNRPH